MQRARHPVLGFTLIELMIIVVVIAILAAIAFPAYQNYVRNAQRNDGTTALMQVALAQERHRANNPTYAATIGDLVGVGVLSPEGRYDMAIVADPAATATSFSATATKREPEGGIRDPDCRVLALQYADGVVNTGVLRSGVLVNECWRR